MLQRYHRRLCLWHRRADAVAALADAAVDDDDDGASSHHPQQDGRLDSFHGPVIFFCVPGAGFVAYQQRLGLRMRRRRMRRRRWRTPWSLSLAGNRDYPCDH